MGSEFLTGIVVSDAIINAYRAANQVFCTMQRAGKEMTFLATDENDWHGVLMVQYQQPIDEERSAGVQYLCRGIEPLPLPALFHLEFHEYTREIRAVMRWPLHEEFCPCEDANSAMQILFDYWTTVEPFIKKVSEGEDVDVLIAEANRQLDALFPNRRQQTAA